MAIVFSDASYNSDNLFYWALISSFAVSTEATQFSWTNVRPLDGYHLSDLVKVKDRQRVPRGAGSRFITVETPDFLQAAFLQLSSSAALQAPVDDAQSVAPTLRDAEHDPLAYEQVWRRLRRHQSEFRENVLKAYGRRCAISGTDVPHPRYIAGCPDETVMGGAAFYLMEPVDGFNASVALPALHASDVAVRHAMGLQAADAIARLGAVDHIAVGLADFGQPEGFLERQVGRWMSELESYSKHEGYPGPEIPGVDEVAAAIR